MVEIRDQYQTRKWQKKYTDQEIYQQYAGKSPEQTPYSWLLVQVFRCRFCQSQHLKTINHLMHECPYLDTFIPLDPKLKDYNYNYYQSQLKLKPKLENIKIRVLSVSDLIQREYLDLIIEDIYNGMSPGKTPLSWIFDQILFCQLCGKSHFLDECPNLKKHLKKKFKKCTIL